MNTLLVALRRGGALRSIPLSSGRTLARVPLRIGNSLTGVTCGIASTKVACLRRVVGSGNAALQRLSGVDSASLLMPRVIVAGFVLAGLRSSLRGLASGSGNGRSLLVAGSSALDCVGVASAGDGRMVGVEQVESGRTPFFAAVGQVLDLEQTLRRTLRRVVRHVRVELSRSQYLSLLAQTSLT